MNIECPRCGIQIDPNGLTSMEVIFCPTCGYKIKSIDPKTESSTDFISNYIGDLKKILIHPQVFFRHVSLKGGIARPLVFALATHWIASAISFLWTISMGQALISAFQGLWLSDRFGDMYLPLRSMQEKLTNWFLGIGPIIVYPFITTFSLVFTSVLLWIAARLLISQSSDKNSRSADFEGVFRLACFTTASSVLSIIPFLGVVLAPLYAFVLTVIAFKEAFQISTPRALVITIFPKLIFPGIVALAILVGIFSFASLFF